MYVLMFKFLNRRKENVEQGNFATFVCCKNKNLDKMQHKLAFL